jgi:hypothetical protein
VKLWLCNRALAGGLDLDLLRLGSRPIARDHVGRDERIGRYVAEQRLDGDAPGSLAGLASLVRDAGPAAAAPVLAQGLGRRRARLDRLPARALDPGSDRGGRRRRWWRWRRRRAQHAGRREAAVGRGRGAGADDAQAGHGAQQERPHEPGRA